MSDNNSQNLPWLGRQLTVVESTDSSLLGRSGLVVDETMRTVAIDEVGSENRITLAKAAIKFLLDDEEFVIDGGQMEIRPEDRINRRFKNNGE
ncbi:MAG: ribonuclease P protein subunit [Candidatus Poseidoniaceae archaeon]|nr:ribonuclease P protein subunit [Candidatus Poseidoniaceae archaeon]MDP7001643.1 ribonuclease P protein subunit [Candidatus Poseidoniaceae archaeon]